MLLTSYNLSNYILQRSWYGFLSEIETILDGNPQIIIQNLDKYSPRNTLLCCKFNEKEIFVFKQPKFLTNGATWYIIREFKFYQYFIKNKSDYKHLLNQYWFDGNYNILVTPYCPPYKPNRLDNIEKIASYLGHQLAGFHKEINLRTSKSFNNYVDNFPSNYQIFIQQLIQGYKSSSFLDENLFRNWLKISSPVSKNILYCFLWESKIMNALEGLLSTTNDSSIIHGDLKQDNLLIENENIKFIDFETVSKGDVVWDIACLIESFLSQGFKHESDEKRFAFFDNVVEHYIYSSNIQTDNEVFYKKILTFYALRLLERFRSTLLKDDITINLPIIKLILTNTDKVYKKLVSKDKKMIDAVFNTKPK